MAAVSYLLNVLRLSKKENKTLAGRSQGQRKRYWRGIYRGGYMCMYGCEQFARWHNMCTSDSIMGLSVLWRMPTVRASKGNSSLVKEPSRVRMLCNGWYYILYTVCTGGNRRIVMNIKFDCFQLS